MVAQNWHNIRFAPHVFTNFLRLARNKTGQGDNNCSEKKAVSSLGLGEERSRIPAIGVWKRRSNYSISGDFMGVEEKRLYILGDWLVWRKTLPDHLLWFKIKEITTIEKLNCLYTP